MIHRSLRRGMGLFALIWLGQVVSILGSGMTSFALGVKVFQNTGSVTRFALIGLCYSLPNLLLSPIAGVLADRWDRRKVLILSRVGSALTTLALYLMVQNDLLTAWRVYPLVAVNAAFTAFAWPAFIAATTVIVGKRHYGRASGMNQMGIAISQIVAPLLGGVLVVSLGLQGVIVIDFATFLFAAVTLLLVRFPAPESTAEGRAATGTVRQQMGHGWRFVVARQGLFYLLLLFAFLNFSVGIVQVLLVPLVLSFASPLVLGVVLAIASSGTLVGGTVMSVWGGPQRRVPLILMTMLGAGLLLLLGGLRPSATLIASAAFFFLLMFPIITGCAQAIWQSKVPEDLQGRVFAIRRMIAGSSLPVALALAGPLADYVFEPLMAVGGPLANSVGRAIGVGPGRGIGLLFMLAGLGVIVAVAVAARSRALRQLEDDVPDLVRDRDEQSPAEERAHRERHEGLGRLPTVPALVLLLLCVLISALAVSLPRPGAASDATAAADTFSAARAMAHVETVAREPHPVGTAANQAVRDYLEAELRALNLDTEVQRATVATGRPVIAAVSVENVVARLPDREPRGGTPNAVLLVAHYDSVATSPGAADNGAAVATLLETARALRAGPALRNDVLFLFSDGEEIGLHGARAFIRQHPWARDVAVVLNFDARGKGGPVYMFQTGADNGWWLPHFIDGAPRPVASSLMSHIYRKLPNDTDFTAFLDSGFAGFNFAFIEGLTHYHSMLDNAAQLDARSVQHQGSYALGLARHLADLDLDAAPPATRRRPDRAYFNLLGTWMVSYPRLVAIGTALLTALAFFAVLLLGLRRGRLTVFGLWQGALAFLGAMVAIPVAVTLVWLVVRDTTGVATLMNSTANAPLYMLAFVCFTVAAFALLHRFYRQVTPTLDLAFGALMWWLLLLLLTSGVWLPADANFIIVWPLLFSLAGMAYLCFTPAAELPRWRTVGVLALTALPGLLLVPPFAAPAYIGLQSFFQLGGPGLLPVVLLLGLLIPHLEMMTGRHPYRLVGIAALASLAFFVWALVRTDHGAHPNSVLYAQDADQGEQYWYSLDPEPDAWTAQFELAWNAKAPITPFFPLRRQPLPRGNAPAMAVDQPRVEVLERGEEEDLAVYKLRFDTPPKGRARVFWFEPADAVVWVEIDGARIAYRGEGTGSDPLILRIPSPQPSEVVTVRAQPQATLQVTVVEQLEGLPPIPGLTPRTPDMVPRPLLSFLRSDVTLVRRTFALAESG